MAPCARCSCNIFPNPAVISGDGNVDNPWIVKSACEQIQNLVSGAGPVPNSAQVMTIEGGRCVKRLASQVGGLPPSQSTQFSSLHVLLSPTAVFGVVSATSFGPAVITNPSATRPMLAICTGELEANMSAAFNDSFDVRHQWFPTTPGLPAVYDDAPMNTTVPVLANTFVRQLEVKRSTTFAFMLPPSSSATYNGSCQAGFGLSGRNLNNTFGGGQLTRLISRFYGTGVVV